jgi:hypothetical protein
MEPSGISLQLATMIQKDWIMKSISEVAVLLSQLENEGRITTEEHTSLWELYVGKFKNGN